MRNAHTLSSSSRCRTIELFRIQFWKMKTWNGVCSFVCLFRATRKLFFEKDSRARKQLFCANQKWSLIFSCLICVPKNDKNLLYEGFGKLRAILNVTKSESVKSMTIFLPRSRNNWRCAWWLTHSLKVAIKITSSPHHYLVDGRWSLRAECDVEDWRGLVIVVVVVVVDVVVENWKCFFTNRNFIKNFVSRLWRWLDGRNFRTRLRSATLCTTLKRMTRGLTTRQRMIGWSGQSSATEESIRRSRSSWRPSCQRVTAFTAMPRPLYLHTSSQWVFTIRLDRFRIFLSNTSSLQPNGCSLNWFK